MDKLNWCTERRRVLDIVALNYNPRKRNADKQLKLKESLDYFNLVDIPVINADNTLISGQRRIEALIEGGRGEELIDVRVPNRILSYDEVRRYCLLANTHVGEWDFIKLEESFSDMYHDVLDMPSISVGLIGTDLLDAAKKDNPDVVDDDFSEPLSTKEPITALGDVYELNSHRLICGDCTAQGTMELLMEGAKGNMVFTDPPYNVPSSSIGGLGKAKHDNFKMASGEMTTSRFSRFLEDVFISLIKASKEGSIHYICMDWKHINEISSAGKIYHEFKNLIVWVKNNGGMGTFYRSRHELILVFKNGKKKHVNNFQLGQTGRYRTNVWEYPGMNTFGQLERDLLGEHPTVKPLKLVADAILDCSNYGDIIIDVFLGSGTTLVASEQTGRICYSSEVDPSYCDLSIKRYICFMQQYKKPIAIKRNGVLLSTIDISKYLLS